MRIFKANGKTGRTYYVFPRKKKPELAIEEAAREAHHHKDDMTIIPVWIKDGNLYLNQVKGTEKMIAVIRKGKECFTGYALKSLKGI